MSELTAEDIAAKLVALRQVLEAQVWGTATAAAVSDDHEKIRELVRLKVDIEAIDFALVTGPSNRPPALLEPKSGGLNFLAK